MTDVLTGAPKIPQSSTSCRQRANALKRRNTALGWSFILPNFLGFAAVTMVPIILGLYMAFTNWNALGTPTWVGVENFERLARNSTFRAAMAQTFYYAIPHIILTGVLALGLAIVLNHKIRGVAFFRSAAFFPYITSIVAVAIVWNLMFSPNYGPINQILGLLGVSDPPGWTTSSAWAMPAVIIVGTWRGMGYYMILFLAGLQTIPAELYEAAKVDGASAWSRFIHVTWPSLRPTTFFVTVILAIDSFKVFDLIQVMTDGGPGTSTYTISYFIYQKTLGRDSTGEFGYASAASLILFFICLAMTVLQFIINQQSDLPSKPRWWPLPLVVGLVFFAVAIIAFCLQIDLGLGWLGWTIAFVMCFAFTVIMTNVWKKRILR